MESLGRHSSVADIYQVIQSAAQLRKLALQFPGRSVYGKLIGRVYRWKRVHKLGTVEMAFTEHQLYTLAKLKSSREAVRAVDEHEDEEDEDEEQFDHAASEQDDAQETDRQQQLPPSKRRAQPHLHASAAVAPSDPAVGYSAADSSSISRPRLTGSSCSTPARRAIIRDVIGEVLPALLLQQKALMRTAIDTMRFTSAEDTSDSDGTHASAYGCPTVRLCSVSYCEWKPRTHS